MVRGKKVFKVREFYSESEKIEIVEGRDLLLWVTSRASIVNRGPKYLDLML